MAGKTTEVAKKDTFSTALMTSLTEQREALPSDFNITRFVQNSVALLNGNEVLMDFAKKNPTGMAQIKAGLMRGAFLGLDALNQEMYLVPYGSTLTFMASYKGMVKLATKYATRPIKSIYAKVVREGDEFQEVIIGGEPSINFKPKPFNNGPIIGAFAVCQFADGGIQYEVMSLADIETCRKSSKAKNGPAWQSHFSEMAKKTVIRRLSKHLPIDMDARAKEMFDAGTDIETDEKVLAEREIAENGNSEELVVDSDVVEEVPFQ